MKKEHSDQLKKNLEEPTMRHLQDLSEHVSKVLIDNARTNTVVYGLVQSLLDESKRGVTRETLKKEMSEAIYAAHEQFGYLFFPEQEKHPDTDL